MGVVGLVGAGKSSLIQAVLGEMDKLAGRVEVKVRTSYWMLQVQNVYFQMLITSGRLT